MNDYGTEVKLLAFTTPITEFAGEPRPQDSEALIEYASRLCVAKEGETGARKGYIKDRIEQGHESVLEHASATFYIKASRVLTHELVRHRIASYSQRSQRYVSEQTTRFIFPPELVNVEPAKFPETIPAVDLTTGEQLFNHVMDECWKAYNSLLRRGVRPELARYVLPNACVTEIVTTMNFRELRHFINLRTSHRALPEMREVAGKVRDICKQIAPNVFYDM